MKRIKFIFFFLCLAVISACSGMIQPSPEEVMDKINRGETLVAEDYGTMNDCVPHEDISGYVYMVSNWAHRWFRHSGYVSSILGHE